jgi:hypothetical protein
MVMLVIVLLLELELVMAQLGTQLLPHHLAFLHCEHQVVMGATKVPADRNLIVSDNGDSHR